MAAKRKPFGIDNIISIGATVVIIGLLFKINHYPYAETMIAVGLGAEAFLFLILGLKRDTEDVDWTRAYPELDDDYKGELPAAGTRVGAPATNFSNTAALDKMLSDAKIGPELIASLGDGLRTFGDKVNSISRVGDAGAATDEYIAKVRSASAGYDKLSNAFEQASAGLQEMVGSNIDSKHYHEQVNKLARNLADLNAVYELELQDSSAHLKSMNTFYRNLSLTMQNFNESLDDSKQFKEEVSRLAKNLASLNSVYGNMLSAMNQPRV